MSDAATALLRTGLVRIWRDTLDLEPARLLKRRAAESELQKWENWIRDEADPRIPRAQSVLFIDVTRKGRRALANWDRKPIRIKVR